MNQAALVDAIRTPIRQSLARCRAGGRTPRGIAGAGAGLQSMCEAGGPADATLIERI